MFGRCAHPHGQLRTPSQCSRRMPSPCSKAVDTVRRFGLPRTARPFFQLSFSSLPSFSLCRLSSFVRLSLSLFLWCEFRGGFVPLLVVTACRLHGLARKPAGGSNTKAFCALAGRSRLTSPTRLPPSFLACKLAKNNPEVARCRKNLCNSRLRQDFVSAAELRVFLHTASCMLRLRIPDARARQDAQSKHGLPQLPSQECFRSPEETRTNPSTYDRSSCQNFLERAQRLRREARDAWELNSFLAEDPELGPIRSWTSCG